jgi:asparagine synthase (glutamine-hydrolysing)
MPGIIGCLKSTGTEREVLQARNVLKYSSQYKDDALFVDETIICSRTHQNIIGEKDSPIKAKTNDLYCWVEGEFYNKDLIKNTFGLSENSEAQLLLEATEKNILELVLGKIDGYFAAVIYNQKKVELTFITDRFGFKPLYIWKSEKKLAWSSEIKSFLSFHQFPTEIDIEGFDCFLKIGQFLGEHTWFKKVIQLDASTIATYSLLGNKMLKTKRYWLWEAIQPDNISYKDACKKLGDLFQKAVLKRCHPNNNNFNLALSGGLDSRAILAAIPEEINLKTFTFGKIGCADAKLAEKAAGVHSTENWFFELTKENWFNGRIEGVWRSEAAFSFIHLHGAQYQGQFANLGKIGFNGFAGDLVLGGSSISQLDSRITEFRVNQVFPDFVHHTNFTDPFYNIEKEDPYFINTRVKKFTANGLNEIKNFENRIPFFDNDLIEFAYAIPDHFRLNNKIYFTMLLNNFAAYFKKIPWQASGYPISNYMKWFYFPKRLIQSKLKSFGMPSPGFADYDIWIKNHILPFEKILISKKAIYPEYTEYDVKKALEGFKSHGNNILEIARLITAEIWFQQVFNNHYFTTDEF